MPIKTIVSDDEEAIIHEATGNITIEDIKAAFRGSLKYAGLNNGMPVIWDFRSADASMIKGQMVIELSRYIRGRSKNRSYYKAAIVVSHDPQYGLSRMFVGHYGDGSAEVEVFRDFDQARKWAAKPRWGQVCI